VSKPQELQKFNFFIPLKEILVFCAPLLDLSVTARDSLGQSNFSKLLLIYWVFVSMLLSNLYRGIVVENIVAPSNFEYPVTFDDLKNHSFQIFATESLLTYGSQYKSTFLQHVFDCMRKIGNCPPFSYSLNIAADMKLESAIKKIKIYRNHTKLQMKNSLSKFERRMLNVYAENAKIQQVYEEFMKTNLSVSQAEDEGRNLVSDYLYQHTKSIDFSNLSAAFEEIMICDGTVFVGFIEDVMEIKRRLPARSVTTGQKFYASQTQGYEHNIRYNLPVTGSSSSNEKVPRNLRAAFESGIFNAWKNFVLRLNYINLKVRTKRENVTMKLESRVISFFVSFYVFAAMLSIVLLVENLGSVWNIVVRKR